MRKGNFEGERGGPLKSVGTFFRELCKNGWTERDAVWSMDSGGPREAC